MDTVGERDPINLSDHVEVSLHTTISCDGEKSLHILKDTNKARIQLKQKVRWDKCDKQYYCELIECGPSPLCQQLPNTQFEMDLVVSSLNKVLSASAAPRPKVSGNRRKKVLPLWNEGIALAVERSKQAHKEWRDAG